MLKYICGLSNLSFLIQIPSFSLFKKSYKITLYIINKLRPETMENTLFLNS